MRRAVSLVEVLVVIAIVAVISGIVYVVARPARLSAKRASCTANLRSIYQANILYASDWDSNGSFDEIGQFTYIPDDFRPALEPYLKSSSVWLCPTCPSPFSQKLYSTYSLSNIGDGGLEWKSIDNGDGILGDLPPRRKRMIELHSLLGSKMPLVMCPIHDEFEIYPHDDPARRDKMAPKLLWIGLDGGIRNERAPWQPRVRITSLVSR